MMEVSMSPKVTKRTRRLFTAEFKAEAVRLVREFGKTVAKVARELDLTATCLRAWVNQAAVDNKGGGQGALTTEEPAELTRLRREVRTLEQERDFAKKCAAYFAKDKSRSTPPSLPTSASSRWRSCAGSWVSRRRATMRGRCILRR